MEFQIARDELLKGLQMVQNIVEPRQTLPILANILLETGSDTLAITATDLEVGARVVVPARIGIQGGITLQARKLVEMVKELPSAEVEIRDQENSWVSLRCRGVSYRMVGLPKEDFPGVNEGTEATWISLEARSLKEMIARTSFAISHDESRYALNGINMQVINREFRLVATDGHRLALAKKEVSGASQQATGIVPRKAVYEVARVLKEGEEAQVALTENQFLLRLPNFLLVSRLIEGQFPNYEQVLPKGHPKQVRVNRDAFVAAIRRVSVMSEERTKPIKLILSPGQMRLAASNPELGEAEEGVEAEYAGEELTIGFNSRYLLDATGPIGAARVAIELKDPLSPGIFTGEGEEDALCVIMPMRI